MLLYDSVPCSQYMLLSGWKFNAPRPHARLTDTIPKPDRLTSLDTMRGLIMCLLAAGGLGLSATAKKIGYGPNVATDSWIGYFWQSIGFHTSHPSWNSQFHFLGCSFWDLIQPAFMFMVGVAMPYSYASRRKRGDSQKRLASHAAIRAFVLVLIGVFLQTRNTGLDSNRLFTNVLAQIGLGYFLVFWMLGRSFKAQLIAGIAILVAYWFWLFQFPVGETTEAAAKSIESLYVNDTVAKQFALRTNGAASTDVWLLNGLLQPDVPIESHKAGYTTLNFIPSAVTILMGVMAGTLLKSDRAASQKLKYLVTGGAIAFCLSLIASVTVCPIIKKIWTPSWTLFSGAWVIWALAALYWLIDVRQYRRWTFPFVIVGMNSLAVYLMSILFKTSIVNSAKAYLGADLFAGAYGPTWQALTVFVVLWLACLYLYLNKIFFRI